MQVSSSLGVFQVGLQETDGLMTDLIYLMILERSSGDPPPPPPPPGLNIQPVVVVRGLKGQNITTKKLNHNRYLKCSIAESKS